MREDRDFAEGRSGRLLGAYGKKSGECDEADSDEVLTVCAEMAALIEERHDEARNGSDDEVGFDDWHFDEAGASCGGMVMKNWKLDDVDRDVAEQMDTDIFVNGPTGRFASQGDEKYEKALRKHAKTYRPDGPLTDIEQVVLEDGNSDLATLYPDSTGRLRQYRNAHTYHYREFYRDL